MNRSEFQIISKSPDETLELGRRLAGQLIAGDIVSLKGELGSGKTLFTQGIGVGLNVIDSITSPSFTLVQEYRGTLPVYHFDFYRLNTVADIEALDFDGYLEGNGVVIVEWADKGEALIPEDRIEVQFDRIFEHGKIVEGKRSVAITSPESRNLSGVIR